MADHTPPVGTLGGLLYRPDGLTWSTWDIVPDLANLAYTKCTIYDVIFNTDGMPEFVGGVFYTTAMVSWVPIVWELLDINDSLNGGLYRAHICLDASAMPPNANFPCQLMDLREDETVPTPGVYVCGSRDLLRLNYTERSMGDYGPPFIESDIVYVPDIIVAWTPWDPRYVAGMARIPNENW